MRRFGCLLIVLAVIAGALYAADSYLTGYAEQRTAERLSQEFEAGAEVDFAGWPVSVRMLGGTIPRADIALDGLELDNGAVLDELDVTLTDVEVSFRTLTQDSDELPRAREGTFEARLTEESLAGLLGVPAGLVEIDLNGGLVTLTAAGLEVQADVTASHGDVAFALQGPIAALLGGGALTIDLSGEPGSPSVEEVEIGDGQLVVRGVLTDVTR